MGGLYSTLGNIGTLLGRKPSTSPRTPPFLPPVGPSAPMPPPVPPVNSDPEDDQSYDYNAPPASPAPSTSSAPPSSPAAAVGGIGSRPQYQSAEDTLQHTLSHPPERPKTSLGRQIGGALLMGTGSPIGQTLGSRIAYGQYPQQLAQYQADVANQTAAADQARKTAEEQRKIEQNQNQTAESRARREDLAETRKLNRQASGEKNAADLLASGAATPYSAPPPQTHDVAPPPGVPGLAPTQATVPSPPKPPNVMNIGGQDLQIGKKAPEIKTIEERLIQVLDDPTLTPEQSKAKQNQLIGAHNTLHPQMPIHSVEVDDAGNGTMVMVDPASGQVKQLPLGKTGKTKTAPDASYRDDKRNDTSYQFNIGELNKVGKPVEDLSLRLGRLEDTLAQNNPQADALIAPELLTVMAGGQGSGLRMNEAEIARIVGGRSNWETLKASINKWRLDPKEARSITPAQQQQIQGLVSAVGVKIRQKQSVVDNARQQLLTATSPEEHRRIVSDAHRQITSIDAGPGGQQTAPNSVPEVHDQAEYDRLPPGAAYTQNGVQFVKKKK